MRAGQHSRPGATRLIGLAATFALVLTACGGTASSAPSSAPSTTTGGPSAADAGMRPRGQDPRACVPLVRRRQQLRRPDARRRPGRCGRRQRQAHRLRREPRPGRPDQAAPGRGRVRQVRWHRPPAAVRSGPRHGCAGRDRGRHRHRQHRPDPRHRQHHCRIPDRGPAGERRLRPQRARSQDRRTRREGVRNRQSVQRRVHLLGEGGRPRHLAQATRSTRRPPSIRRSRSSAEGESFYTTALGLKASQDMLRPIPT